MRRHVRGSLGLHVLAGNRLPFIALQIVGLLIIRFVPDVALWLPRMLH